MWLLLVLSCAGAASDEGFTVSDFSFDGPLGSEGASIAQEGPNHFVLTLGHAPNHADWSNKSQFTLQNAKGRALHLDVSFPAGTNYYFNEYFLSYSYDGRDWFPVQWEKGYKKGPKRDTLRFPVFESDTVYVGHQVPMSYEDLCGLIQMWEASPCVTVTWLGESLGGRPIPRVTITDPASPHPPEARWVHYFANQHPGEHNAQWRMAGMVDWLLSEEGADCRARMIGHFVPMMSPDAPSKGWYRVNAQGIDMNRSYRLEGSDAADQAHEAFLCQRDLEALMASSSPPVTIWGMHTWQGIVEPILRPGPEMGGRLGPWEGFRDIMDRHDTRDLIKTLAAEEADPKEASHWDVGPHLQFGVTTVLCEGAGSIYTREENTASGAVLMRSIAEYYRGLRTE